MASNFNPDYPISAPVKLRALPKPFFDPKQEKDAWIYEKLPDSDIFTFSQDMPETMVVHLAGFLTPLFGWKTLLVQEAFPDALYEDMSTHTRIRVEFENNTKSFLEHNHPASGCDVILCWEDNLTQKEREDLRAKNPNLKIVEFKKIFFHYDFELNASVEE
jgi:hypothetical protein